MAKHLFIFIAFLLASFSVMSATESHDSQTVRLTRKKTIPQNEQNPPHRSPDTTIEAYLDGYTLTFDASCIGCPLTLVDEEENIVYATIIDNTGIVELPDTLSGIFELQIIRGNITFVGEIEL